MNRRCPWAMAAVLAVAGAVDAAPARTVITDGDSRWSLALPPGFTAEEPADLERGTMLASFGQTGGRRIVIARLRLNTDAAYAGDPAYLAGLEDGVKRETPGYRRLAATARKLGTGGRIPAYDLWYRTRDAVRASRFVFLRGYAVVMTVQAPRARRVDPVLKRALESFAPL